MAFFNNFYKCCCFFFSSPPIQFFFHPRNNLHEKQSEKVHASPWRWLAINTVVVLSTLLLSFLSVTCLPSQNVPIDFLSAASSKDAAQSRAKEYHDRSKLSLPPFSPGQAVHLQDSKSSAWDKQGVIVSVRPDRLSYGIRVGNRFFTCPGRLLRPVTHATPSNDNNITPTSTPIPS